MIIKAIKTDKFNLKLIELLHVEGRLASAGFDVEPIIEQLNKSLVGVSDIGKYLVITEIASRLMPELFHENRG
jgi:hypothetical protein